MPGLSYEVIMMRLMERLGEERAFVVQGIVSLLLLLITVVVCLFTGLAPEEEGIISAASCTSIVLFFTIIATLGKEGVEGLFYALVGSFAAWVTLTVAGSRLAFDPGINNYALASMILSIALSFSGLLYAAPEKLSSELVGKNIKRALIWFASTVFAILVNFAIIYLIPKII